MKKTKIPLREGAVEWLLSETFNKAKLTDENTTVHSSGDGGILHVSRRTHTQGVNWKHRSGSGWALATAPAPHSGEGAARSFSKAIQFQIERFLPKSLFLPPQPPALGPAETSRRPPHPPLPSQVYTVRLFCSVCCEALPGPTSSVCVLSRTSSRPKTPPAPSPPDFLGSSFTPLCFLCLQPHIFPLLCCMMQSCTQSFSWVIRFKSISCW